jgi:hypothetical protein
MVVCSGPCDCAGEGRLQDIYPPFAVGDLGRLQARFDQLHRRLVPHAGIGMLQEGAQRLAGRHHAFGQSAGRRVDEAEPDFGDAKLDLLVGPASIRRPFRNSRDNRRRTKGLPRRQFGHEDVIRTGQIHAWHFLPPRNCNTNTPDTTK